MAKIGGKNPMHEIKPGLSRGHLPKDATPKQVSDQVKQDKVARQLADTALNNLNSNSTH